MTALRFLLPLAFLLTGPAQAAPVDLPEVPVGTAIAGGGLLIALALVVLAVVLSKGLRTLLDSGSQRVEASIADATETATRSLGAEMADARRTAREDAALARNSQHAELEALRAATRDGREAVERRIEELISTVQGRSHEDALILAESLLGELEAVQTALETHLVRLDAHLTERADSGYSKIALRDLLPRVGAPVFTAQAGRIGLLGGSLAGDIAWVHGSFQAWANLDTAAATRQATISMDEAQEAMEAIEDVREGTLHLIQRLIGFIEGTPVPATARDFVADRVTARADARLLAELGDLDEDTMPDLDSLDPPTDAGPVAEDAAQEAPTDAPASGEAPQDEDGRPPVDDVRLSGLRPTR